MPTDSGMKVSRNFIMKDREMPYPSGVPVEANSLLSTPSMSKEIQYGSFFPSGKK
jgi:hypothetical protein